MTLGIRDTFSNYFESLVNAIKYRGVIFGFRYIFNTPKVFWAKTKDSNINFFKYVFQYKHRDSLVNLLTELFGYNIYYFKSNTSHPVILDLGANIGDSVIYFKELYPESKIFAFEPNSNAFKLLNNNIDSNNLKNVRTYNFGLSNFDGQIDFYDDNSNSYTIGSVDSNFVQNVVNEEDKDLELSTQKIIVKKLSNIDDVVNLSKIDLLKIDVEGSELSILEDIKDLFTKIDKIFLEYHVNTALNSFDKVISILKANKYKVSIGNTYRSIDNVGNKHAFMIYAVK